MSSDGAKVLQLAPFQHEMNISNQAPTEYRQQHQMLPELRRFFQRPNSLSRPFPFFLPVSSDESVLQFLAPFVRRVPSLLPIGASDPCESVRRRSRSRLLRILIDPTRRAVCK